MKNRFSLLLGFAAALLLATNVAYAMQNADVTGEWLLTMSLPNGNERVITLNLEQDGTAITGTALAEGQEEPSEVTGTIEGNAVTLNLSMGRGGRGGGGSGGSGGSGGRGGPRAWEGTVDGDTMSGTLSMGSRGELEWTAQRQ
jgi:hypothetical protein